MKYASDGVVRKLFLCTEVEGGFLPVEQATTIAYRVSRRGRGVNVNKSPPWPMDNEGRRNPQVFGVLGGKGFKGRAWKLPTDLTAGYWASFKLTQYRLLL